MAPAFKHSYEADREEAGKVEVTGRILVDRPKAILFDDSGGGGTWLPKSKIRISERNRDGTVSVLLPEWLAKDKGFI